MEVHSLVHAGLHVRIDRLPGESEESAKGRLWRTARAAVGVDTVGAHPSVARSVGFGPASPPPALAFGLTPVAACVRSRSPPTGGAASVVPLALGGAPTPTPPAAPAASAAPAP